MKILMALVVLIGSTSAFAEYYPVKSKFCDQKPIAIQNEEKVLVDLNQHLLGFAHTEGCRVVDLKFIAIESTSSTETVITPVRSLGRLSFCEEKGTYAGPEFTSAVIHADSVLLKGVKGECGSILYQF